MVPVDCSVFYCRHPDMLRQAFSLVPEILRTTDGGLNMMDYGIPLGRRFRALKLWFVLRYYGHEGLAQIIRDQVAMVREMRDRIAADPRFEICAPARAFGDLFPASAARTKPTACCWTRSTARERFFLSALW